MGSDVVNEIFAEGSMITLARIVLVVVGIMIVVACVYATTSIVVRMTRREWLQRAGGFEPELGQPAGQLDEILGFAGHLDGPPDQQAPPQQKGVVDDP